MRLLLDTHVFLWWITDDARLSPTARDRLRDRTNDLFVSLATVWEIAIKVSVGRLRMPSNLKTFLAEQFDGAGFAALPITFDHVVAVHALPLHHRDPFDRLLIVQSQLDGLPLLSRDRRFAPYDVDVVW